MKEKYSVGLGVYAAAAVRAAVWLWRAGGTGGLPGRTESPPGYARGIDRMGPVRLFLSAAVSLALFHFKASRWPALLPPVTLMEKLIWSKYYGDQPLPSPADKLRVGEFLPPEFRDRIRPAEVLWRSTEMRVPAPHEVPPGRHFVKINDDGACNLVLDFPLSADGEAKFRAWFRARGRRSGKLIFGEWWYETISREIFVERSVGSPDQIQLWCFSICNGRCAYASEHSEHLGAENWITHYDRDFNALPITVRKRPFGPVRSDRDAFFLMRDAAERLAAPMSFARVDFIRGSSGDIYLNEITLCPLSGATYFSDRDFDRRLGLLWDHRVVSAKAGEG